MYLPYLSMALEKIYRSSLPSLGESSEFLLCRRSSSTFSSRVCMRGEGYNSSPPLCLALFFSAGVLGGEGLCRGTTWGGGSYFWTTGSFVS